MLKPSEILVGSLDYASGLTLVLPRSKYEYRILLFEVDQKKYGLILEGGDEQAHRIFECGDVTAISGILIPSVEIEIDPKGAVDADGYYPPRGSLIRQNETLSVQTSPLDDWCTHRGMTYVIQTGLPKCKPDQRACFMRWQIVLGQGLEKRVLHTVDVTPA